MAKRVKKDEGGEGGAISNVPDGEKIMEFVRPVETLKRDLAKLKGEFMAQAKTVHADIRQVYKDAKAAGFKKRAIKGLVEERELFAKIEDIGAEMEGEDKEAYDTYRLALEKLGELGQAALKAAA